MSDGIDTQALQQGKAVESNGVQYRTHVQYDGWQNWKSNGEMAGTESAKEISLEEAKEVALKHANLNESNLTLTKAREENDDGKMVYEIEWHDGTYEYDFDISKTGEILHYDKDRIHD